MNCAKTTIFIVVIALLYLAQAPKALAEGFSYGDPCSTQGLHQIGVTNGDVERLVCDGSNWRSIEIHYTSSNSIVIGRDAYISSNPADTLNIVIGNGAGTDTDNSIVIGNGAYGDASGYYGIAIGDGAYFENDDNQIAIGRNTYVYGDNAVVIGYGSQAYSAGDGQYVLGYGGTNSGTDSYIFGPNVTIDATADNTYVFNPAATSLTVTQPNSFIINGASVGIGDATPDVELDVVGDINYTGIMQDVSDIRMKENIQPLSNPLEGINALSGFAFTMKGDNSGTVEYGVSAQDVQKVFPELVSEVDQDGTLGVSYIGLIPPMIEAMKELTSRVEALEAENQELKTQLEGK